MAVVKKILVEQDRLIADMVYVFSFIVVYPEEIVYLGFFDEDTTTRPSRPQRPPRPSHAQREHNHIDFGFAYEPETPITYSPPTHLNRQSTATSVRYRELEGLEFGQPTSGETRTVRERSPPARISPVIDMLQDTRAPRPPAESGGHSSFTRPQSHAQTSYSTTRSSLVGSRSMGSLIEVDQPSRPVSGIAELHDSSSFTRSLPQSQASYNRPILVGSRSMDSLIDVEPPPTPVTGLGITGLHDHSSFTRSLPQYQASNSRPSETGPRAMVLLTDGPSTRRSQPGTLSAPSHPRLSTPGVSSGLRSEQERRTTAQSLLFSSEPETPITIGPRPSSLFTRRQESNRDAGMPRRDTDLAPLRLSTSSLTTPPTQVRHSNFHLRTQLYDDDDNTPLVIGRSDSPFPRDYSFASLATASSDGSFPSDFPDSPLTTASADSSFPRYFSYSQPPLPNGIAKLVEASTYQTSREFVRFRHQDAAITLVAMAVVTKYNVSTWTGKNLDQIIHAGNELYSYTDYTYNLNGVIIPLESIHKQFRFSKQLYQMRINDNVTRGRLSVNALKQGIFQYFTRCNCSAGALYIVDRQMYMTIFLERSIYYLFDSHERNLVGGTFHQFTGDSSVLIGFAEADKMAETIVRNIVFEDDPADVEVFKAHSYSEHRDGFEIFEATPERIENRFDRGFTNIGPRDNDEDFESHVDGYNALWI